MAFSICSFFLVSDLIQNVSEDISESQKVNSYRYELLVFDVIKNEQTTNETNDRNKKKITI